MTFARRNILVVLLVASLLLLAVAAASAKPGDVEPQWGAIEQLGQFLYEDESLSSKGNQSCESCHDPDWGFTGPDSDVNAHGAVYAGSLPNHFGNRKPPSAAYAGDSPVLYYDEAEGVWIGGMFWDGRATGNDIGDLGKPDPLAEQAKGPFLNPLEQTLPNAQVLCNIVEKADYAHLFVEAWGAPVSCTSDEEVQLTYARVARAIAAFERSDAVNPYTSKYDYYLKGEAKLTKLEKQGLRLFNSNKAMCSACHPAPLFTDFTYDNLGVPRNPENPFYTMPAAYNPDGEDWIDYGLGGFLGDPAEYGKHKVPTLRNVDKRPSVDDVKAYGHNGYFKSLLEIVHFYNTRDVEDWPEAEVPETVNFDELGNLGLTLQEEEAIVAFLKTLSDGYVPEK